MIYNSTQLRYFDFAQDLFKNHHDNPFYSVPKRPEYCIMNDSTAIETDTSYEVPLHHR